MNRRILQSLIAFVIPVLIAPRVWAQSTAPTDIMYHEGPVHTAPGQAIVLNSELTDHFGDPLLTVPVEFHLEDKDGNLIYTHTVALSAGRSFSEVFIVGPDVRIARSTIQGDIYAAIGPDVRLVQPCLRVTYPPGPTSPADQFFATLEVVDVSTGRTQTVSSMRKAGGDGQ